MTLPASHQQMFRQASQHHQAGRLREAEQLYRRILAEQPDHADSLQMLGILAHQVGRGEDAVNLLRRATAIRPQSPEYRANLGAILAGLGRGEEAVAEFRQALAARSDAPELWANFGRVLRSLGRRDEAIEAFDRAVALRPNLAEAHNQLGDLLRDTGRIDDAMASYRRAMAVSPDPRWGSSLVRAMQLHPDFPPRRMYEAHLRWNQTHAAPHAGSIPLHRNDPTPQRKLKLGYVLPDFREDADARLLVPLLAGHDHAAFDLFFYSNSPVPEAVGRRLPVENRRDLSAMNDQQAAEQIVRDGIDVFVDLSMHGVGNRLPVFARRPAPVQVTGLAYPGTTGLFTIDARLTDANLESDGMEEFATEPPVRLPEIWRCYEPPSDSPRVSDSPAARNGFVTFGCLGDFAAFSRVTLESLAAILSRVANSRAILRVPTGSARERVAAELGRANVPPDRIEFVDQAAGLELDQRIDIALDTFPWNGLSATLEALDAGVPVITMSGATGVSRIGRSLLNHAGLSRFATDDPEAFIETAVATAGDTRSLAELRSSLRDTLRASPLCDIPRYVRAVEDAYRDLWRKWCARQTAEDPVSAAGEADR